jgi:predicted kinase
MAQELILIRGLPGSGKSTFAASLLYSLNDNKIHCENMGGGFDEMPDWVHHETDDFFIHEDGKYVFEPNKISEAHAWNWDRTHQALSEGYSVIVSNTFSRVWEMRPYIDMADKLDIKLTVLTVEGNFGNVHNVPEESIEKMRKRWEPYNGK